MNVEREVVLTNTTLRSTYLKDLIGIFLLGIVVGAGGLLSGFG
jgi:hypothetical protein